MKYTQSVAARPLRTALIVSATLLGMLGVGAAEAQSLRDVRASESPLVLKSRGSFYVGGEPVEKTAVELGSLGPDDRITVNQMYVEYMVPAGTPKVPVVMVHGATLSGKTYDTTPDGRMGWYEYFVRKSHPVYVVDQVGRARSGFDQSAFNNVRAGKMLPDQQPNLLRLADRFGSWTNFRIGPEPGKAFPDTQFPVEAAAEMSAQSVPDLLGTSRAPNPNWKALSDLALQVDGAVLLTHSQSGPYPLRAALINAKGIRAIVMVEPGTCNGKMHTDDEIAKLAKTPIFVLFGDHLASPTGLPGPSWENRYDDCKLFKARVDAAKGDVRVMTTVDSGVRGNSHMMMMDKNNLQIADLILAWIGTKAAR
jgi:pimeloyl-ACP methyl ester carboxylesterase